MELKQLLKNRQKDYGSFKDICMRVFRLKRGISLFPDGADDPVLDFAKTMICLKIARLEHGILTGTDCSDSIDDFYGYLVLMLKNSRLRSVDLTCALDSVATILPIKKFRVDKDVFDKLETMRVQSHVSLLDFRSHRG